jgi:hypothetical protein
MKKIFFLITTSLMLNMNQLNQIGLSRYFNTAYVSQFQTKMTHFLSNTLEQLLPLVSIKIKLTKA